MVKCCPNCGCPLQQTNKGWWCPNCFEEVGFREKDYVEGDGGYIG
jgi:uncharacterized Zn finger protein (UPF0148 family)